MSGILIVGRFMNTVVVVVVFCKVFWMFLVLLFCSNIIFFLVEIWFDVGVGIEFGIFL